MWKYLKDSIGRLLLPGIILQSVLIGGGFATGREIVEYGARFGPPGLVSGLSIFLGFSVLSVLTFEAARKWQVFDYKSLVKKLSGKAWIGFEITYLALAVLIIAVMAAAAGEILNNIFGLNYWLGVFIIIGLVALLNFKGEEFIARMKTIGTVALFAAYILFGIVVISERSAEVVNIFTSGPQTEAASSSSIYMIIWTGILYVGYNLAVYPATFFTLKKLKSRRDSIYAGVFSGLLMTIPWFLTFLALMAFYPDPEIMNAPVPWLIMLEPFAPIYILIFGVVVGWTLVETATGMIHGFIGRLDNDVKLKNPAGLSPLKKSGISIVALAISILLAQVGIIDLIAKGYTFMAYGMILFYAIPLLISAKRIWSD